MNLHQGILAFLNSSITFLVNRIVLMIQFIRNDKPRDI